MINSFLATSIEYLKGVGPQRADLLKKELQLFSYADLIHFFPFRYVDRTKFYKIKDINEDLPYVQIRGKISDGKLLGEKQKKRYAATFVDDTGKMELVWFQGSKYFYENFKPNTNEEYIVFGKAVKFNGKWNIAHPDIELCNEENTKLSSALQPIYNSTEKLKSKGLDSKAIHRLIKSLLLQIKNQVSESMSEKILTDNKLMPRELALIQIHLPQSADWLQKATYRLKFEELFFLQLKLLKQKKLHDKNFPGFIFSFIGEHFNNFYNHHLPFELTNAQKRVIKEIRLDMKSGKQMNRLLQGDVGSGKTLVALMNMLIALDNNFQACLMAPTEILAQQHFNTLASYIAPLNLKIALLTGSTKSKERNQIHENLLNGSLHFLVGTHALLEDGVKFKNLGLVVIDEQHRFGVAQRALMWKKNTIAPHVLIMSATPIPRTLAMTLYGDLDVSVIDEMPSGRKPIKTKHVFDNTRENVFSFMKEQIKMSRQVYVVYPLINESEKMDYVDLMNGYEAICRSFPRPNYHVSIVHGQMKSDAKEFEMKQFVEGKTQIMVATTVIEVGVNVPNATVMVIESAERFGLSQLHQLRGRVGRGAEQSYCVLVTSYKLSKESKLRIDTMCKTNDGFEISEVDLRLRGPGDMAGTQQSGMLDLKISDLAKDAQILYAARNTAMDLIDDDLNLEKEENKNILTAFNFLYGNKTNWSRIS
jgi:ATP-dependent DNA helicase RecG